MRPNGRLDMAKVGEVRVRWSRDLPSEPSSVTIIREADGHYYASFVVDVPAEPLPVVQREAGVDVGISRLATVADTCDQRTDIANPRHLQRSRKHPNSGIVGWGSPPIVAESTPSCERTGYAWGVHDCAGWLLSISTKT
jgi:hypothetical protein